MMKPIKTSLAPSPFLRNPARPAVGESPITGVSGPPGGPSSIPLGMANKDTPNAGNEYRIFLTTSTNVRCRSRFFNSVLVRAECEIKMPERTAKVHWDTPTPGDTTWSQIQCDF